MPIHTKKVSSALPRRKKEAEREIESMNRSQIVTGSQKHRDPRYRPFAFTEHCVAMLSAVLKSDRAVKMSILIVRAFVKLRELLASNKELARKIEELEAAHIGGSP